MHWLMALFALGIHLTQHIFFKVCYFPLFVAYCCHLWKGLDVAGFSQFKRGWAKLLFSRGSMAPVKKDNYLELIEEPYRNVFTVSNILAGFKKTGIWPLD
jgi:xylose isomerase